MFTNTVRESKEIRIMGLSSENLELSWEGKPYVCVHTYTCTCVYIHTYVHMCIYAHIHMYNIYTCIYTDEKPEGCLQKNVYLTPKRLY